MAQQQQLVDDLQSNFPLPRIRLITASWTWKSREILHQAVELLPAQQKQIYLMSKEQELKREEIAKTLRIQITSSRASRPRFALPCVQ